MDSIARGRTAPFMPICFNDGICSEEKALFGDPRFGVKFPPALKKSPCWAVVLVDFSHGVQLVHIFNSASQPALNLRKVGNVSRIIIL